MKKVVYFIILILFIGITVESTILLENAKTENKKIEKEISETNKKIEDTKTEQEELNGKLDNLKEETKDQLEEYEIWEKAKNKLNQAL